MHLQHARAGHSLIHLHRSCHGGHRELHESHCTTNATKGSRAGFSSELVQCRLFRPHAVQVLHNNAPIRSGPVLAVQKHFQPGAPFLTGVQRLFGTLYHPRAAQAFGATSVPSGRSASLDVDCIVSLKSMSKSTLLSTKAAASGTRIRVAFGERHQHGD